MKPFKHDKYPELPPDVIGMDLHDEDYRVCIKMYIKLSPNKKLAQRLHNRIRAIERAEKKERKKIMDDKNKRVMDMTEARRIKFKENNPNYQKEYRTRKKLEREQTDEDYASER